MVKSAVIGALVPLSPLPVVVPTAAPLMSPVLAPPSMPALGALQGLAASPAPAAYFDGARAVPAAATPASGLTLEAIVAELLQALARAQGDPAKIEEELIGVLAKAHMAGLLEPALKIAFNDPRVIPHLPPIPEGKRDLYAAQVAGMIGAELEGAGRIPGTKPFEPWDEMSRRQLEAVARSAFAPRGPAEASLFTEAGFVAEYEALTGAKFSAGNETRALIDGPASFAERFRLMRAATKSVFIQSWAFYDDATGAAAADLLIAKHREGVAVKVMVDGKTAALHGAATLARLKAAGVEVVLFQDAARRYDGLHTKVMVVDGEVAIAGGMNFGDEYSHMGGKPGWRDTDLLYRGPEVARTLAFMAELWNAQVAAQGLPYGRLDPAAAAAPVGGARLAFLADGPEGEATILLAHLKAIAGASRVINIENAYLIEMPQLRAALLGALARGVKVNILTNSAESVDEPIVSAPILASLPDLVAAGATVGLKQGTTLHSKFMTVDGIFSIVGSFNLHPRSVRYEHELIVSALDAGLAAELDAAFARDLAAARRVAEPSDIAVPDDPLSRVVRRYLYNQL